MIPINRLGSMIAVASALVPCCGCPGPATGTRVSDVPCLKPTAWEGLGFVFLTRPGPQGTLLLTTENPTQEGSNGSADDPHGSVYRFDPASDDFDQVDDTAWENGDEPVTDCFSPFGIESSFSINAFELLYEDRVVSVAGDSAVTIQGARVSEVIAVLSANGVRPIPFLGVRAFDGQHYHELFSNDEGTRIGSAVRIGVGARQETPVRLCWTLDEEYLIYYDLAGVDPLDVFNVCIVAVGDTLREAGLKVEP